MDELPSLTWDQLVNERRVEMAFEETTYWDLLRWGVAVEKMSGATNPLKDSKRRRKRPCLSDFKYE